MDAEKEPPKDPPPETKPPKFQTEGPPVLLPCKSQEGIKLGVTKNTLKLFPKTLKVSNFYLKVTSLMMVLSINQTKVVK